MRTVVVNHVSLDGVMQGPGRPDEDTRNGFRHGGWARSAADDPAIGVTLGERMGRGFSWLFGRRSYEMLLEHWNEAGGPFKDGLNGPTKYVVSSNPDAHLPWPNSELVTSAATPTGVTLATYQPHRRS
jgi:dihydrofolate reductase